MAGYLVKPITAHGLFCLLFDSKKAFVFLPGEHLMKKIDGRYEVFGNPITKSQSRAADKWRDMIAKKFNYDPNEKFKLSVHENPYLGDIFGLKDMSAGQYRRDPARKRMRRPQHHSHGIWPLPHRHGGRLRRQSDGFHPLLARPARHPRHHHRRHQLVQHQLQQIFAHFTALSLVRQIRLGIAHHWRTLPARLECTLQLHGSSPGPGVSSKPKSKTTR